MSLLRRYDRNRDEAAFAALVKRYVNLVYSAALRRVACRQMAQDVTQAVFVVLARRVRSVRRDAPLSGWLLTTVRYAAAITIAKGAIRMMTWTQIKLAAAVVTVATMGTAATVTVSKALAADAASATGARAVAAAGAAAEPQKKDDSVSLAKAPPVVVRALPQSGAADVDATIAEIRVTYSKDMQDGSWSWSTWGDGTFPQTTGKPRYDADRRTCILPVKLEPGHTYAIWLNSEKFGNFKDADGRKAVPYLLVFETK
jgi:RNA polymerase sigma-70 factor (ECF subfamily)